MVYLKEDGSLDIEKINNLPLEDFTRVVESLTEKEYSYFASNQMINECIEPVRTINVDYTLEEDIQRNNIVIVDDFLNKMRENYGIKK